MNNPTTHQFTQYQKLYDWYNDNLFTGQLPSCLLILSRKTARICGHFSQNRWQDSDGKTTHEINLNPVYLSTATDQDICQTLVHEMVHLWQYEFGKPSRSGYHNKEWADKMESVGLMPSNTGKKGGNRTGQQMADYAIKGGVFMSAYETMPNEVLLPFKSSEMVNGQLVIGGVVVEGSGGNPSTPLPSMPPKKNKLKYSCPRCQRNAWGKPGLQLVCYSCIAEILEERKTIARHHLNEYIMTVV